MHLLAQLIIFLFKLNLSDWERIDYIEISIAITNKVRYEKSLPSAKHITPIILYFLH